MKRTAPSPAEKTQAHRLLRAVLRKASMDARHHAGRPEYDACTPAGWRYLARLIESLRRTVKP